MVYAAGFLFSILYAMEKKTLNKRIAAFDVLRVVAMVWVVTYHFGCEYKDFPVQVFNFFYLTKNFDFGNVAVTLFLSLSGLLLYSKYGQRDDLTPWNFFVPRTKKIYPPFWVMNLYVVFSLAKHWWSDGNPFFLGNPLKLLLTVFGIDGLAQVYGLQTYFFGGEWFIGAILLLYLLFPYLAKAYRKQPVVLMCVLAVGYVLQFLLPIDIGYYLNVLPFTLVVKFVMGFAMAGCFEKMTGKGLLGVCAALAVLLLAVEFPEIMKVDFLGSLFAWIIFPLLLLVGRLVEKSPVTMGVVSGLSAISYHVFLVQHVAIKWMQILFEKVFDRLGMEFNAWICFGLLWITFAVILMVAFLLKWVTDKLVKFLF